MATKTFEELKQMAIQVRDEQRLKANTAYKIGNILLDIALKSEDINDIIKQLEAYDLKDAVDRAENAATSAEEYANIASQSGEIAQKAKEQGDIAEQKGNEAMVKANYAAQKAEAAANKAINEGLFKTPQDLSEEEKGQVKRNIGIENLATNLKTLTIEGLSATVNATTTTKSIDNIIPKNIDFMVVDLGLTDGREQPDEPSVSVILAKTDGHSRIKLDGFIKLDAESFRIQVISGAAEKDALSVLCTTSQETTYKIFQVRYFAEISAEKYKGHFSDLGALKAAYSTARDGSYAFVGNPRHLYTWEKTAWMDQGEYITEVDQELDINSERAISNKAVSQKLRILDNKVFPLSLQVSGGGVYEKGTTQRITVAWSLRKGNDVTTADSVTVNEQPASGTNKVYENVNVTTTYTVKATKESKQIQGSTTATFVNASYFGAVPANFGANETNIKGLNKNVKNEKGYTSTANLNNQKVCYAYPKSFGALASIKDANNFEYLNSYNRSELNVNGETYYVYLLKNATTITGFKQIYS